MAACTIVITQNADLSLTAVVAANPDFVSYIPNGPRQTRRLMDSLNSVVANALTLDGGTGS